MQFRSSLLDFCFSALDLVLLSDPSLFFACLVGFLFDGLLIMRFVLGCTLGFWKTKTMEV